MFSSIRKYFLKYSPAFLFKPVKRVVYFCRTVRSKTETQIFKDKLKFFCPCCGKRVRKFVEVGYMDPKRFNPSRYDHTKQDVLCPNCRALPRHRILATWCDIHKELFQDADTLYFAPEYSMTQWMKRNGVKYTSADLFNEADLKVDIQNTGLPDESYDIIIANHVLEHVDDFRLALKEMYRVLRPSGSFICSFPMDPKIELLDEDPSVQSDEGRFLRFGQNDHKRIFGMKADQILTEAGFEVEKICGDDYPEEILPVVGPADYDMNILFRCVRPGYPL